MKRIFYTVSIISTILFLLVLSCSKKEIVNNSDNADVPFSYSIDNNILAFESESDYEDAINYLMEIGDNKFNDFETEISFLSMRRFFINQDNYENIPVQDDLFATLLNPQGHIKIGEYIYEIDAENELVYATKGSLNNNTTLKSANSSDKLIFSFEDEVLDEIKEDVTLKRKKKYCKSFRQYAKANVYTGHEIETVLHYQKFGIYYSLKAEINKKFYGGAVETMIYLHDEVYWKNKKGSGTISAGSSVDGGTGDKNIIYRFYSKRFRLKDWRANSVECGWWDSGSGVTQYHAHWKSGSCSK
jgi:hypothetical protein